MKQKYFCLSILISVFVFNVLMSVSAAQTNSGNKRLEKGIESYEDGKYDGSIFNLEMAKIQISEDDKERLWKVHFYLGLSYYLTGDNEAAEKEIIKTNEMFDRKLPDPDTHSLTQDSKNI